MSTGFEFSTTVWAVLGIVIVVLFAVLLARRYVKVGPNEVLIVSGIRHRIRDADGNKITVGYRLVRGGGTFVIPVFERVDRLSLELFTLDVNTPEVYTQRGVPLVIDGIAQVKIKSDDHSARIAAEQLLSKGRQEIMRIGLQTLEGHLRSIIGTLTVEEAYSNRNAFAARVAEVAESDMIGMGMTIVSFTIRDIKDRHGYMEALGRPQIAEIKKTAEVSEDNARRDTMINAAKADQEGRTAQLLAETQIAEADRDKRMKLADFEAAVQHKQAAADMAYELEKQKISQQVCAEQMQVQLVEKIKQVEIEQREVERKEKELIASVEKPAAAERFKIETLAEGEAKATRQRGEASAHVTALAGKAEAEVLKAKGLAEAEVGKIVGEVEAATMDKKAASWKNYNEAAIIELLIDKFPEIARAVSEPLAKMDKMVVVSTDPDGGGAARVTQDITKIITQLPPVVESLTGLKIAELLKRIPGMNETVGKPDENREEKNGEPPPYERKRFTLPHAGEEKPEKEKPGK